MVSSETFVKGAETNDAASSLDFNNGSDDKHHQPHLSLIDLDDLHLPGPDDKVKRSLNTIFLKWLMDRYKEQSRSKEHKYVFPLKSLWHPKAVQWESTNTRVGEDK